MGHHRHAETFVVIYLAVGFAVAGLLAVWAAGTAVRRDGLPGATASFWRELRDFAPQFPGLAAWLWLGVLGIPLIALWTAFDGFVVTDLVVLALLWVPFVALLRWHRGARRRDREASRGRFAGRS